MPGESRNIPLSALIAAGFQSTPGINAGRIGQRAGDGHTLAVSIHARH